MYVKIKTTILLLIVGIAESHPKIVSFNDIMDYGFTANFENELEMEKGIVKCKMKIKNAIVQEVEFFNIDDKKENLESNIVNKKFSQQSIRSSLNNSGLTFNEVNSFLKLFQLA